jgi:hypothetical protein
MRKLAAVQWLLASLFATILVLYGLGVKVPAWVAVLVIPSFLAVSAYKASHKKTLYWFLPLALAALMASSNVSYAETTCQGFVIVPVWYCWYPPFAFNFGSMLFGLWSCSVMLQAVPYPIGCTPENFA